MTMTIPALATVRPSAPLELTEITRPDPGPHEVLIDIRYTGICHSDIHQARDEWGGSIYPMVPGHEITGIVEAVGAEVSRYAIGDRVGVGCYIDSCRTCANCLAGEQQHCLKGEVATYNSRYYDGTPTLGGYSTRIVVDEDYVLSIPDSLNLAEAAPLLCAGITTYQPLRHWNVGPGTRVAVVGMGGLGHIGVKLAAALGADVTVLSQTLNKQQDGIRFGAHNYFATNDPATFPALERSFDFILNTVSTNLDLDAYLSLLALDGVLVNVGVPSRPDVVNAVTLGAQRRSVAATKNGGIPQTQEMLDFCGQHGIGSTIETISIADVNDAYTRVLNSDVRYRFVIDISSFDRNPT